MSLYCEELHMNDHSSTLSHGRLRARRGAWAIACVALFLVQLVASAAGAPDTPAPVVVINSGIGGHNSKQVLGRIERDALDLKPDVIVLMVGTNDVANSHALVPLDAYAANVEAMVKAVRDAGSAKLVLVNLPPVIEPMLLERHPNHPHAGHVNEEIQKYNAKLAEIATANGLTLVDFYAAVNAAAPDLTGPDSPLRNPNNGGGRDGVHMLPRGYRMLGKAVADALADDAKPGMRVVCVGDSLTFGYPAEGQGTARGQTYPAVLNDELNRKVGVDPKARAFAPIRKNPPAGNLVYNGDFTDTDDGLTAFNWRSWQMAGRYGAAVERHVDDDGEAFIDIRSTDEQTIAYLLGSRFDLLDSREYVLSFTAKGTGSIRMIVVLNNGDKVVELDEDTVEQISQWHTPAPGSGAAGAGADARTFTVKFKVPADAKGMVVGIQVRGEVKCYEVRLRDAGASAEAMQQLNTVTLANDRIRVVFLPPDHGGGLAQIVHPRGWQFLKPSIRTPLWSLRMRTLPAAADPSTEPGDVQLSLDPERDDGSSLGKSTVDGGDAKWLDLRSDQVVAKEVGVDLSTPARAVFYWRGIDLPDEAGALDVTVTASLGSGDRFVRFRTSIVNRSTQRTVFLIASPRVEHVYPQDGRLEADYLASPVYLGRLIQNPLTHGILGQPHRYQPNRSGHSMQFDAYYHEDFGLYLGCFDGEQNVKRYELTADSNAGLGWAVVHLPNNIACPAPQQWTTPYDTVVGCFDGDWYDACMIYRQWATQQSWTSQGPLVQRADLPKWFAEIDDWIIWGVDKNKAGKLPELYEQWSKQYNLGLWCTHWGQGHLFGENTPDLFPLDDADKAYIEHADQLGMPIMSYIQAVCWTPSVPSFEANNGRLNSVRDYDQNVVNWLGHIVAWPGEVWTRVLGDTVVQMAQSGMRAAYLDSFNHGGTYLNFNPIYCTSGWGGGNQYIKSAQNMLATIKQRAREIDPGFCFTAESFWEGNMAQLDAYLTVNTTNQYLRGSQVTAIPMANAVYHDYTIMYAAWVGKYGLKDDMRGYYAQIGQAFVWGIKPGFDQPSYVTRYDNFETVRDEEYPSRLAAYAAGREFLVYGQMLRKPQATHAIEKIHDIPWYVAYSQKSYNITLDVVQYEAWRLPDGRVGLSLYNLSLEPQTLELSLGRLAQQASAMWTGCKVLYGPEVQTALEGDRLTLVLPARRPAFVELTE